MVKNHPSNAGDAGYIPGSGRSPGEGNGNPLQYSCLGNSMDREAWRATVHRVTKSWIRLSDQKTTKNRLLSIPGHDFKKSLKVSIRYRMNLFFFLKKN